MSRLVDLPVLSRSPALVLCPLILFISPYSNQKYRTLVADTSPRVARSPDGAEPEMNMLDS